MPKNMQISPQETITERAKYLECETKAQGYKMEKLNETKKENPIDWDNQVASFREELLKVKREKHNWNASMKDQNDKMKALEKRSWRFEIR